MDNAIKMKGKIGRTWTRFEQGLSQKVGRAEKTDVFGEVQDLDRRVERMMLSVRNARTKMSEGLRTKSKEESADKRKKKYEHEFSLVQTMQNDSKELQELEIYSGLDPGLLSTVIGLFGHGQDVMLDELIEMEMDMESQVLDVFGRYGEEEKNVKELRERLKRAVLDMDAAKRRLHSGAEKSEQAAQDELDKANYKVLNLKDNYVTDLYTLAAKEIEIASIFAVLFEIQLNYHRTAVRTLDRLLPDIRQRIATYSRRPVYGCPLEDHLRYSKRQIALVLEVCCASLNEIGLLDEGLFRISGNQMKVKKLKAGFDAGEIDLTDFDKDPHSLAGALKLYLRELPEPLMTHQMYSEWVKAADLEGEERKRAIQEVLSLLPPSNYNNLRYLVKFLRRLADNVEVTKMGVHNIAIVIGPNLIWSPVGGDNMLGSKLVECLLTNAHYFYPDDVDFSSSSISSLFNDTGGFQSQPNGLPFAVKSTRPVTVPPTESDVSTSAHSSASRRPKAPAPRPPRSVPPPPPPTYQLPTVVETLDASESAPLAKCASAESDLMAEFQTDDGYSTIAVDHREVSEQGYSVVQKPDRPASTSPEKTTSSGTASPQSGSTPKGHRKTQSLDTPPVDVIPVRKAPSHPSRPPPPSKEVIERNAASRGSGRGAPTNRPVSYMVSMMEENQIRDEGGRPQQQRPPLPTAAPRRHVSVVKEEQSDEENRVTLSLITPEEPAAPPRRLGSAPASRSATTPDSPKPPLPVKPKTVENDWAVTKL